jgi:hypothetical protein
MRRRIGARRRRVLVRLAAALAMLAVAGATLSGAAVGAESTSGPWLGLNGNSNRFVGPVEQFVEHNILYDRGGAIELLAGETLAQAAVPLEASIKAGMIPIVIIEYDGYSNCTFGKQCLPTSEAALREYARGFVSTAQEILDKYPAAGIMFQASNEPWGYGSASQYAAMLARLLPRLARSRVPPSDVYVGVTGQGWVKGLYEAQPQLRSLIGAWYVHPYAKERKPGQGMAELPGIRSEMAAGQNNVIVSEMGFCAVSLAGGQCIASSAPAYNEKDAAEALYKELQIGLADHRAGWLKALLVYSRSDGGWAMQLKGGMLTEPGKMLEAFGDSYG